MINEQDTFCVRSDHIRRKTEKVNVKFELAQNFEWLKLFSLNAV